MNTRARVLNVNDDTTVLKLVSRVMREAGYEILEAESGIECLEIAKEQKPDIILLDVVMPDLDGLEVCRLIKQDPELSDIIVIHLSALRTSSENRTEGLVTGADGYIKLPIDPRELVAEVQSLVRIKETELRNSEKLWRAVFEAANDIILLLDEKLRIEACNNKAVKAFGYDEQTLKGMSLQDLLHPEYRDMTKRLERSFSADGELFETRHQRKDGSVFPAEVSSRPFLLGAGRRLVYSIRDIARRKESELERVNLIVLEKEARKQAEDAAREKEESLAVLDAFMRSSPLGFAFLDLDLRYILVNDALAEMNGVSREETIGRTLYEVVPHLAAETAPILRRVIVTGEPVKGLEISGRTSRRQALQDWIVNYYPIRSKNGEMLGVGASVFDITDRKRAEANLRASEEQYRILFDNNPIPMWVYDADTLGFLTVNSAAVNHYGYTRDEFLAMTVKDIRPQEDLPLLMNRLQEYSWGYHYEGVWRHKKRDGSIIYAEIVWHGFLFSERRAKLVIARDVTDRYSAEEEQARLQLRIRNAALEWQKTFDAIESPVLILDSRGSVKRMNRAARDLSETTYHKCIGRGVFEISSGEPWQKIAEAAMAVQTAQTAYSCQARDSLTGRSWDIDAALFISSASKPGPDSERIIVVTRDTTKIAQLQESLRRSETLSAMGSLTAAVAHEVRNPIFSIQATLDAFEARFGVKEEYKRHLGILRNEVSRLAQLMQDLLDYGKPPALEFSEGSLVDIVAQAINACRNAADRMRVAIVNNVGEDLVPIRRDPGRLFQALQNIIENSIQHSPPGAVVTIAAKPVLLDNRLWIDCIVKDSGPGFKDADLPKIFEPFFSKRRGGIGLGLAIVHRIVEEHGGKVFAENRPEGGSMMTVRLPASN